MLPKYLPGTEPEEIKPLMNMFFSELDNAYSDKHVILSEWNHERWDKAAGTLCSFLGYEHGKDFLTTYGYKVYNDRGEEESEQATDAVSDVQTPSADIRPDRKADSSPVINNEPVIVQRNDSKRKENPSHKTEKSNAKWIVIAVVVVILFLLFRSCGKSSKKTTSVESSPTVSSTMSIAPTATPSGLVWIEPNSYVMKKLGDMEYSVGDTWTEKIDSEQVTSYYPYGNDTSNEALITVLYAGAATGENLSLDTVTKNALENLASQLNSKVTYTKISDSDIDERPSQKSSFEINNGQINFSGQIVVIFDNERAYLLLGMQQGTFSDNLKTAFSKVISSIKFNEEVEETSECSNVSGIRPEVKEFLDSYEAFIDEYVEFMSTYDENSSNSLGMLMEYTEILQKYAEFADTIDNYEEENDLTTEEAAYYIEVTSRCAQKMLKVLG